MRFTKKRFFCKEVGSSRRKSVRGTETRGIFFFHSFHSTYLVIVTRLHFVLCNIPLLYESSCYADIKFSKVYLKQEGKKIHQEEYEQTCICPTSNHTYIPLFIAVGGKWEARGTCKLHQCLVATEKKIECYAQLTSFFVPLNANSWKKKRSG